MCLSRMKRKTNEGLDRQMDTLLHVTILCYMLLYATIRCFTLLCATICCKTPLHCKIEKRAKLDVYSDWQSMNNMTFLAML